MCALTGPTFILSNILDQVFGMSDSAKKYVLRRIVLPGIRFTVFFYRQYYLLRVKAVSSRLGKKALEWDFSQTQPYKNVGISFKIILCNVGFKFY